MSLLTELKNLKPFYQERLHRAGGLNETELLDLVRRPDADPAQYFPDQASAKDVIDWSDITPEDEALGEEALLSGQVAFAVLAGGVGTRLGTTKSQACIPQVGLSMLGLKLLQAGNMPVWVMVSPTHFKLNSKHVQELAGPPGQVGALFEQFEGCRLTPDNHLSMLDDEPDMYPLGHGDLGPALVESGVLDDNPQVKWVVACNVDNVMASPHPGVIGRHIRRNCPVTVEVVERQSGERGGVMAWVSNHLQIAEDFRLPEGFAEAAPYLNTNTMVFNAEVLRWDIPWRWHRVRKVVDSRLVVQFERLLQQYTEECEAEFVLVPRDVRFLGVKTPEDMERAGAMLASHRFKP